MSTFDPDYSRRDYLLPPGCKDLIDVLRLKKGPLLSMFQLPIYPDLIDVLKPKKGLPQLFWLPLEIRSPISVRDLAALLGRKPFQICADLIELAVMADPDQMLPFEVAAKDALKYGFAAQRVA